MCDEGKGFDAKEISNKLGLDIGSMQRRARLLGREFEIHSELGKGTRIEVGASAVGRRSREELDFEPESAPPPLDLNLCQGTGQGCIHRGNLFRRKLLFQASFGASACLFCLRFIDERRN